MLKAKPEHLTADKKAAPGFLSEVENDNTYTPVNIPSLSKNILKLDARRETLLFNLHIKGL